MSLPNILTVGRIILTAFYVYFLLTDGFMAKIIACGIFAVASITDYFDGYIAKKYNLITDFGKIMDPIADKFLMLASFYLFAKMFIIPMWMFVVVAFREVLVTVLRLIAVRRHQILAAEKAGKYKTVFQVVAISLILILITFMELDYSIGWVKTSVDMLNLLQAIVMYGVVILTVYSGASFMKRSGMGIIRNKL